MIRKQGILTLLILGLLSLTVFLLLSDRWLEGKLENMATVANGAKVEIDDLDLNLFKLSLTWQRLQITDKNKTMENLLETGRCVLNFEFLPLLSKKLIIEEVRVDSIRTGTARRSDGKIERKLAEARSATGETIARISERAQDESGIDLDKFKSIGNVDSLVALLKLTSPARIDSARIAWENKFQYWDSTYQTYAGGQVIDDFSTTLKSIDPKKISNLDDLQKNLKKLEELKKQYNQLSDDLKNISNQAKTDFKNGTEIKTDVQNWFNQDLKQLKGLAKLPEFDTFSIGSILFGRQLTGQVYSGLGYVKKAKYFKEKYIRSEPEKKKQPRFKGQDIYFYTPHARPDFWLKKLALSAETPGQLKLGGELTHLVSDQRQINQPTEFRLHSESRKDRVLDFSALFDFRQETEHEDFKLLYSGFSLAGAKLTSSETYPQSIAKGTGQIESRLEIHGDELSGNLIFNAEQLNFEFAEVKKPGQIRRLIEAALQDLPTIRVKTGLSGTTEDVDFSFSSNLDKILTSRIKEVLGAELTRQQERLTAELRKKLEPYMTEFEGWYNKNAAKIEDQRRALEEKYSSALAEYQDKKKEIETKINKEKSKLEDAAKKKIKNLLK